MYWIIICTLFLFCSCGNAPYRGSDALGADEFVMDSYQIRSGKNAILQLEGVSFEPLSPELLKEYPDVIQNGDILAIALYHPSRSDITQAISSIGASVGFSVADGSIVLPDLGSIQIAGLSLEQARLKIQEAYLAQIQDVQIFLTYKDRTERKVELAGLVSTPAIPVDGKIRLFEILARAHVPTSANLFKSYMIRDQKMLPVDLFRLLKEGDMSQNVVMRGGDKIYIAETSASSIMVLGEVGKECAVDIPNGFMTLRQALAAAQGIPYTGNKSYIQIIRGNIAHPKIYTLSWNHIIHLPSDSLLLIPGDIVYVGATPIAEWNRFVSQILPTFIGIDLVSKGIKSIGVNLP